MTYWVQRLLHRPWYALRLRQREELSQAGAVYIAETPLEAAKWLLG
ncbi:MAG: hypothetical protein ACLTCP_12960 [Ruminococcus bicirculans (ex Wegman et al. 2014)]